MKPVKKVSRHFSDRNLMEELQERRAFAASYVLPNGSKLSKRQVEDFVVTGRLPDARSDEITRETVH